MVPCGFEWSSVKFLRPFYPELHYTVYFNSPSCDYLTFDRRFDSVHHRPVVNSRDDNGSQRKKERAKGR
jgi:hypothetical protein